jgi:exonuclease SbcC
MWIRAAGKSSKVRRLRAESGKLAETLSASREIDVEFEMPPEDLEGTGGEETAETPDPDAEVEDVKVEEFPIRPEREDLDAILDNVATGEATSRQTREYTEREMAWLAYVGELLTAETQQLDEAISEEEARLKEGDTLHEIRHGMLDKRDEVASRVALRRKALELLNGAIAHLSNNFNRDIKDLVARMLPLFTDARYEHLQIDDDLKVRVFSSEKRDFMSLEEVSSGTQRQIMLALRLALSQKLLSRTVTGKQFAFLDEPFAFFDEERTRKALKALANLGEDVSQVWIVAQTFPEDSAVEFMASIECQRGQSELILA